MPQDYDIINRDRLSIDTDNPIDLDLEFQNFHINDNTSNVQNKFNTDNIYQDVYSKKQPIWSIEFYSKFFNIDSDQVIKRFTYALFAKKNFLDSIEGNLDFYGPFWITTTTIFAFFFSSTLSEWIKAHLSRTTYNYDFSTFTKACSLIYGYNTIIPIGFNEYFCLYGYAMSIWIPVAIINIPVFEIFNLKFLSTIIRWTFTIIGIQSCNESYRAKY
ncbi:unnamed protein product [Pneumocystis jirovecii]|uniref:Protein YIP n=1 Tax=Pneumocystis jirovecii TaxID=42068 RepID=L0PGS0_PNEJI|nr:unnamed protein product [Pneumocystis jirovecii]